MCILNDIADNDFYNMSSIDQANYQLCSCRNHLWSARANRFMKKNKDGSFTITSVHGCKYSIWPVKFKISIDNKNKNTFLKSFLIIFFFALLFACVALVLAMDFNFNFNSYTDIFSVKSDFQYKDIITKKYNEFLQKLPKYAVLFR
jgi:hypothetical protein